MTGGQLKRRIVVLVLGVAFASAVARAGAQGRGEGIPQLRRQGTATQLLVDGAPFLILGGELGNSSASSLEYLRPFWPKLRAMHLNTVLAPVYWELVEPVEGRFNFATVDSLLADARGNDMRLVLLWFGSWKNSMSSYAPAWVKTNQSRFPRTEATRGHGQEILSPFAAANVDADSRAFAALMRHLRSVDGTRHTVIMVQVENEIGMIPEARDHSALADSSFSRSVADTLMRYLSRHRQELAPSLRARWDSAGGKTSGTWQDLFGRGPYADELFMAWYFAAYAGRVAAAGKAEYPLPMYVNAALIRPGYVPGQYVSAGPLPHLVDVWRAAAPSIDLLAPDIYFPNFVEWTGNYVRSGNPLFIPEVKLDARTPREAFYAIGGYDAIGFSPFAIESATDADAASLGLAYELLGELAPLILREQGRGSMTAVIPRLSFDGTVDESPQPVTVGGSFAATVSFESPPTQPSATLSPALGGGLIIALAPNELLIAGSGIVVTFEPTGPGDPIAGILSADEGRFVNGQWKVSRRLNGDQTHQGRHIRLPPGEFTIQRVKLYRYR